MVIDPVISIEDVSWGMYVFSLWDLGSFSFPSEMYKNQAQYSDG